MVVKRPTLFSHPLQALYKHPTHTSPPNGVSIPVLDIIIVNWNAGHQLRDCLESIMAAKRDGFFLDRVVVVDNASTDSSLCLSGSLKVPLVLIRNTANRGFGAACNQGADGSRADYLLFLNPDTCLFTESLSKPVQFMEHHPGGKHTGICGVQLVNDKGEVSRSCSRFPTVLSYY